jgi:predicted Fe-Mo cluster-binding NifX family protein
MKIALSSNGTDLNAQLERNCQQAPYFLIVDSETMEYEVVVNQQNTGVQGEESDIAALLTPYKPTVLLTGQCGDKASRALKKANISVLTGITGSIQEALGKYLSPICAPRIKVPQ